MLGGVLVLLVLTQIDQPYPEVAPLHHLPTLAVILAAPFALGRWPLSNGSVACLAAFLALHTIGGRYTYVAVPHDAWTDALFGSSIGDALGFTRNHYDRFVHMAYGLLMVRPVWDLMVQFGGIGRRLAIWLAVAAVTAVSGLYEIFEWGLTLVLAGPLADDYNGQQGDMWDAQKDMALALLGAIISALALRLTACRSTPAASSTGRPEAG